MKRHTGKIEIKDERITPVKRLKIKEVVETVQSILLSIKKPETEEDVFTEEQSYSLSSLSLKNKKDFLSLDNRHFIYDLIMYLMNKNIDEEIDILEKIIDNSNKNSTSYDILFDSELFKKARIKYYSELDESRDNVEIKEGIHTCPKCKKKLTISVQKQTRSADEGATTFIKCTICKYTWKEFA
jgi:DNA-directed RNA polymerase subunit M/transcription elongation factor TFIIS